MKFIIGISSILFILVSCIYENSLKPIIPNNLINANSAKTWVKTKHIKNNKNLSPQLNELQTSYTFYSDGTFREQQMIHLGSDKGRKGRYSLTISEKKDTSFTLSYLKSSSYNFHVDFIDVKVMKLSNDSVSWTLETLKPPIVK